MKLGRLCYLFEMRKMYVEFDLKTLRKGPRERPIGRWGENVKMCVT